MRRSLVITHVVALVALVAGCPEAEKKQVYYDDLKPPLGLGKVTVVSDVSMNTPTGGDIKVAVAVDPKMDKDELDQLMRSFFRQAYGRKQFKGKLRAKTIDLRFYDSEAGAKAFGEQWLGRAYRGATDPEESYYNRQLPPLDKWARKAMRNDPLFPGAIKPKYEARPKEGYLRVVVPMVKGDGSGEYKKELTFEKFSTELSSYVITLFDKLEALKKLTFVPEYQGKEHGEITLTREQYESTEFKNEEELLGAFHGEIMEKMLTKRSRMTEERATKLVHAHRRKVFRTLLGKLPEGQVKLSDELRKLMEEK